MSQFLDDLENYLRRQADPDDLGNEANTLLQQLDGFSCRYGAAILCADWVMTAYTRASEDNGGDSGVSWDELDYAAEAARQAFTDAEIEEFNDAAKEYNE